MSATDVVVDVAHGLDDALDALEAAYGAVPDVVTLDREAGVFEVRPPGIAATHLADLVRAVTGLADAVPDWMPLDLHLEWLTVARVGGEPGYAVAGRLAVPEPFTVVEGLRIEDAAVEIEYRDGAFFADITGAAGLTDIDMALDVSLELPSQTFMIELHLDDDADPVDESAGHDHDVGLFERLGLPRSSAASPRLHDLLISGSVRFSTYRALVEVDDLVHVPGFTLGRLRARVDLGAHPAAEVEAVAAFAIGSTTLELDLAGRASSEGWTLTAEAWIDQPHTLGDLVDTLAATHGAAAPTIPAFVADLALQQVEIEIDTVVDTQHFGCRLDWPHEGATMHVALDHAADGLSASADLRVDDLVFVIAFDAAAAGETLVGAYHAAAGSAASLADILGALGADVDGVDALSFDVHDAIVAYHAPTTGDAARLAAADLGLGVDLAALHGLPLVGPLLPPDASIRLVLQPLVSTAWPDGALDGVRSRTSGDMHLPERLTTAGPHLSAKLTTGGAIVGDVISLDPGADDGAKQSDSSTPATGTSTHPPSGTTGAEAAPADAFTWHELGRAFGPLHLDRIGLLWRHDDGNEVAVAIDGRLAVGGLSLSLDGLALHYGIDDHRVSVGLRGLGLEVREDPIRLGGAFLNRDGDFLGRVLLTTEEFTLSAVGAFAMVGGQPSMFVYGVLDEPLGGPVFFFVEGLAAGFGYNRRLHPPAVGDVRAFPLVEDAVGGGADPDPTAQLERLHEFVSPALGEYFLAVGVKFTSFKLLDSFALLVVRFGEDPEIDVIGASTYQSPPGDLGGVPAMAHVELNLLARFPLSGESLVVEARITPKSYLYATACHLSGGFAFATWFSGPHGGDFVLTVGGYHPRFRRELHAPHYPAVPRLEIRYQVNEHLYVKGAGYFALTPSLFMAGAAVEAVADIGSLHATFRLSVDFLIGWEPYHYEADASVYIAARWKCFHTHASADLSIRGPDFGGHAEVQWTIFSFDIDFGSRHPSPPQPIGWARFTEAFLPAPAEAVAVRCAGGLIAAAPVAAAAGHDGPTERWIVTAKDLVLTTTSPIPALAGGLDAAVDATDADGATLGDGIGVAPMEAQVAASTHVISVLRDGSPADADFTATPIVTRFPGALWGRRMTRGLHDELIPAVSGYRIVPATPPVAGATRELPRGDLTYTETPTYTVEGEPPLRYEVAADDVAAVPAHSAVAAALGLDADDVAVGADFASRYPVGRATVVREGLPA